MKNNVKKILIVLSCIFTCVLPVNVFAAEDEVLECITDFLSTCQITSENLSVSESVPTYKDGKILTTDTNYIIFSYRNTNRNEGHIYLYGFNRQIY